MTGPRTGPRAGSRPWALSRMKAGDTLYFRPNAAGAQPMMQQIVTDAIRVLPKGAIRQRLLLAIHPQSREVVEIIEVTRLPAEVTPGDAGTPSTHPEAHTNARVRAEAPQALAALKLLLANIHDIERDDGIVQAVAQAQAVIAKMEAHHG